MPDIDGLEMKTRVDEILNRHPALGFALGVVRNGSLEFFHGHGVADLASGRPVAEDTVFRIASITKTFTAIAVMQLWEQRTGRHRCARQRLSSRLLSWSPRTPACGLRQCGTC